MSEPAGGRAPRVIVFGDVIDDVVTVPLGPIRANTDTPSSIRFTVGGSAANTAAWLGVLGVAVDFVGIVGIADVERHTSSLTAAGVSAHITGHPTLPTGTIVVIVDGDSRTMFTERGANRELDPDAVTDSMLASAAVLHLTGYSLFGARDAGPLVGLIARARAAGVQVSVDPGSAGFIEDYGTARFLTEVGGATLVFPNLEEGALLTGLANPLDIAAALAHRFGIAAVTMDADGVLVAHGGNQSELVPAAETAIVDPTGGGDAFSAGFIHEWLRSGDPVLAARAGSMVAARAISAIGARPAT